MTAGLFSRYVAWRFLRTIFMVFFCMFLLVYLIDFVEMLRRAGDIPGVSPPFVALLVFMRVPSVSEQLLPFAVLFGTMITFLNLSRRLELVVARAAGLSVWQILTSSLIAIFLVGIVFITAYNPLAALFRQQASRIETRIFGKAANNFSDSSQWIRQNSSEGPAIIRAIFSSDYGTVLSNVTVFAFTPDSQFRLRIDADRARLTPGAWMLENAYISSMGVQPKIVDFYRLPTTLTTDQVMQSFVPADTVPFWQLPALEQQTREAGLDATAYSLQFQILLARPMLLTAMVLVAATFSLKFFRLGGIAKMIAAGILCGFVLYVTTKLVSDLGKAGLISTVVAAWLPAIVGALLGTLALLYQEDG